MSKTPHEALKLARELLSDQSRWTQGEKAIDADGNPVLPRSKFAVCFCAIGAVEHVTGTSDDTSEKAIHALDCACDMLFGEGDIVMINDDEGYREAMRAFDLAIEATAPQVSA